MAFTKIVNEVSYFDLKQKGEQIISVTLKYKKPVLNLDKLLKRYFNKLYYYILQLKTSDITKLDGIRAIDYLDNIDLNKQKSIIALRTLAKHKNKAVVLKGIKLLKGIKSVDSKKIIKTTINYKDQSVVLAAISALKSFGTLDIIKPLEGCLERKDKKIAIAALWALAEIKSPEAVNAIESVFDTNDNELKQAAGWILKGYKKYKQAKA